VPCFGRTDCVDSLTLSRVVYNTSTTSCGVQDPFDDFEVPDVNNDFRATLQVEFKTNRKIEDCGVNIEVTCVSPNFFFSPECTSPDMFPQEELTTTEAATETMAIYSLLLYYVLLVQLIVGQPPVSLYVAYLQMQPPLLQCILTVCQGLTDSVIASLH